MTDLGKGKAWFGDWLATQALKCIETFLFLFPKDTFLAHILFIYQCF
jgi:hypothetical protein